jgi:hypothetical protein
MVAGVVEGGKFPLGDVFPCVGEGRNKGGSVGLDGDLAEPDFTSFLIVMVKDMEFSLGVRRRWEEQRLTGT